MSYDNLNKLVEYCRNIQTKDDSDIFFGVTGRKGSGKTSFSIQTTRRYIEKYFDERYFSVHKYICYDNNEVDEKMHTLPTYAPIVGDEGIRFAWSREWNKPDNKSLVKLSTQIRPKKHILFLNIPRMAWIDKAYREGMLTLWAWIHTTIEDGDKKSYAIIFEPDENQGQPDSWHMKLLQQKQKKTIKVGRFTDIDQMYKLVKNHPCFFDIVQFPKVPEDIYTEYMDLRMKRVLQKAEHFVNQRDLGKIFIYNIMKNWDAFDAALQKSRFKRPHTRMVAETLCFDPATKKSIIQATTITNWMREIAESINEEIDILEEEKEDEPEKDTEIPEP